MSEIEVGPNYCGKLLAVSKSRFYFFFLKVREQRRKRIEL